MMTLLEKRIRKCLEQRPLAYPEIEVLMPPDTGTLVLGLTLTRMVLAETLHMKGMDLKSGVWPVYSLRPISKKFPLPKRDALLANPR